MVVGGGGGSKGGKGGGGVKLLLVEATWAWRRVRQGERRLAGPALLPVTSTPRWRHGSRAGRANQACNK